MLIIKKVIQIFKDDLLDIFHNPAFIIIMTGVLLLPSLYAWFNIKASWDPYGNTNQLKVAVVNEDIGYENGNKDLHFGREIVEELKNNNNLDWQFMDRKTAMKGINNGSIYATIVISKDFSEDMVSILSDKIKKPTLLYYVNEKLNAVAPKITSKGATALQSEIQSQFLRTASGELFKTFSEIGISIEKNIPFIEKIVFTTQSLDQRFPEIERVMTKAIASSKEAIKVINSLQNSVGNVESTIKKGENVAEKATTFIVQLQEQLENLSPIIKRDLQIVNNVASSITEAIQNIRNQGDGNTLSPEWIKGVKQKLQVVVQQATAIRNLLQAMDQNAFEGPITSLNSIISKSNTMIDKLQDPNKVASAIDDFQKLAEDLKSLSGTILNNYDSSIASGVSNFINSTKDVLTSSSTALEKIKQQLPKIAAILETADKGANIGSESLQDIQDTLPELKSKIHSLANSTNKLSDDKDLKELANLLIKDVKEAQDFVANPVNLEEHSMYPIPNYGTALSPFYTALAIWVGGVILVSLLSVGNKEEKVFADYTDKEIYLGRILLFLLFGLIQSCIVALGDLFLLHIFAKEKVLFFLSSLLISLVFVSIIYTLVSLLGNVGKATAIVLLVFQIAASGGVFPVQVSPHFFQLIHPFLPFTYATSLLRETIGGIYTPTVYRDISVLLLFFTASLLLGIFLKRPINHFLLRWKIQAKKSRLLH